jgi:hypothetical protein
MFPLRDSHNPKTTPVITYLIIALNFFMFLLELVFSDRLLEEYALFPSKIDFMDIDTLRPFITSQFLHAGFLHLVSNMWFLKIFGDNVEEKIGHISFLATYVFAGVVGSFAQYLFLPHSTIPMLGASAAVAGTLGAYFVFFPRHMIDTLIPLGLFVTTVKIPASVVLLYWFVIQLFSGFGSIVAAQVGGIAWWAHVGGFLSGYIIAKLFQRNSKKGAEGGTVLDL